MYTFCAVSTVCVSTRRVLEQEMKIVACAQDLGAPEMGDAGSFAVRTEPYVMLLDPSSGFVAPTLPTVPSSILGSDSEPDLAAAPSFAGTIRPVYRSHSAPGVKEFGSNSPSSTIHQHMPCS